MFVEAVVAGSAARVVEADVVEVEMAVVDIPLAVVLLDDISRCVVIGVVDRRDVDTRGARCEAPDEVTLLLLLNESERGTPYLVLRASPRAIAPLLLLLLGAVDGLAVVDAAAMDAAAADDTDDDAVDVRPAAARTCEACCCRFCRMA